ncbi:type 1 glutamine amidotransferase domain-containing protein [Azospirillum rugosum]|uniref:Protease I n=1 Tax=Azospirillum rugosum TaxID=416170 RepID=A0ABS4SW48_9PROT|nr:type 1 glutamine amidotransferase domain-containing protein [Azospirillum rugosum]MBP2296791.1 protease I [Azospirillum rugosum]MDQ0530394.1 protease I [Azospirillum rugosum]
MNLADAQVAVLAENLYQELELWYPVLRLREAGANVVVVAPTADQPYASKLGYPVTADRAVADVTAEDFDAVVIPGGFAPEGIRRNKAMVDLVRAVHDQGGLVAAVCHAGWVLASAGIARGRTLTCVSLIKDDVVNAGANYVDEPVVRDGNIITSRLPSDLPVFAREIVAYLEETPSRRSNGRMLMPANGRASSSAAFTTPVELVMGPRGKASANYVSVVVEAKA